MSALAECTERLGGVPKTLLTRPDGLSEGRARRRAGHPNRGGNDGGVGAWRECGRGGEPAAGATPPALAVGFTRFNCRSIYAAFVVTP
jgi:hypothetical protein